MRNWILAILMMVLVMAASSSRCAAADVDLTVYTDEPSHVISPVLYGLFFEDINFAADGGLYAELIRNRSYEFENSLFGWSTVEQKGGQVQLEVLDEKPLNANNPHYLRLTTSGNGAPVGIKNAGYHGIVVKKGSRYLFSVYARSANEFDGILFVRLESKSGDILGQTRIGRINADWQKYSAMIESKADEEDAELVLLPRGNGSIDLDMVSLFPEDTWKRQSNGLRADLVQMLADMKPSFIRFPGGCIVEGKDLANAYRWKDTIGDPAERKLNWNRWAGWKKPPEYYQSYGLGFYEFFRLCDDIGAEPLPILNCGMSCQYQDAQLVPLDQLEPYVQDTLDLIEYANGPADSTWGAKRAAAGHPEPFHLKYLGVGNEQWGDQYFERYRIFYKAIKAKYPDIQIVTTSGPGSDGQWYDLAWGKFKSGTPADIVDEHYYRPPQWFLQNTERYDSYDRKGPKVFAGEYAAHHPDRKNDLSAALAEAAFMTGLERNSDVVVMASYAPLFARTDSTQWAPDLIWFNKTTVYGTPSYYVQKLFSTRRGSTYLKNELNDLRNGYQEPGGRIGLCTWQTTAEFKDVKITRDGEVLFSSLNPQDWKALNGQWEFRNGSCVQSDERVQGAVCLAGDPDWSNYTLSLKARKISGREGFIIIFRRDQSDNAVQLNLGGWGNTKHAIQRINGSDSSIVTEAPGSIEQDRWYDIQIVLKGETVRCLLDGKEICTVSVPNLSVNRVYASCTRDEQTQTTYIKTVNPASEAAVLQVHLKGNGSLGSNVLATILTGDEPDMENSLTQPKNICPETVVLGNTGKDFTYVLKPYSVVFFEIK